MIQLLILFAVCLITAWIIDQRQTQFRLTNSKRQEYLFTWILILILGFYCGLRTRGNDTTMYLHMYKNRLPFLGQMLEQDPPSFSSGMGFHYIASALKTLGFSSQDFLVFFAFLTLISYVLFVRKYSKTMVFGVFLLFATGMYTFTMAAMKQTAATAVCLFAISFALKKQWFPYMCLVGIASLFHPYAIIYFIVPLLTFKPLTNRTYICMGICIIAGFFLKLLLGTILSITDMMGAGYTAEELSGDGVNIFRVLVSFVPLFLAFLYKKPLFKDSTPTNDLMFNLSMINALIMFIGLFGTANYFARLANYFLPAQVITIPWLLRKTPIKDRKVLLIFCVVGYSLYFIYANTYQGHPNYRHVSLWEYLASVF